MQADIRGVADPVRAAHGGHVVDPDRPAFGPGAAGNADAEGEGGRARCRFECGGVDARRHATPMRSAAGRASRSTVHSAPSAHPRLSERAARIWGAAVWTFSAVCAAWWQRGRLRPRPGTRPGPRAQRPRMSESPAGSGRETLPTGESDLARTAGRPLLCGGGAALSLRVWEAWAQPLDRLPESAN